MEEPKATIPQTEDDIRKLIGFINKQKGVDLTPYRESFLMRRLRVRMAQANAKTAYDYVNLIKKDPDEFNKFLETLGVNVTEFFRDREIFDAFRKTALSELIKKKQASGNKLLRIWSAACASGEEPYSIAMMLKEELQDRKDFTVRIFATDMDKEALGRAEKAEYKAHDLRKLDKKTLEKYFTLGYNNLYSVNEEIRQLVRFQQHNLFTEPPLTFMDVIFCRNLMIYLNRQQQDELITTFYNSLNTTGYLIVGKVESVWNKQQFDLVALRDKIYRKID
jgi:chemotaxis protein methyltransferase CheR